MQFIPNLAVGGAERMMLNVATGLDHERFDVLVLTFFDTTGTPVERELARCGIPVVSLGKKVGFDPRMFGRVAAALEQLDPDILHTHRPVFPYALPALRHGLARRVVHTVHSVAQREVSGRARKTSHWLAFCAGASPVAICDFVARSILEVYGIPARTTIPNGVPVRDFAGAAGARERWRAQNGIHPDTVLVTSVARLDRPKLPDAVLEAFATLSDVRDAVLAFIGDGPLRPALEAQIRARGLEGRVHLLGQRTDISDALAASDLFVLASAFEGSPLSVMEAMASGLPVIATSVGGIPELVVQEDTGLLVPPGAPVELAAALRRLVTDAGLRATAGRSARVKAQAEFDVSRMVARYAALYEEILEEQRPATNWRPRRAPRQRPRIVQLIPNLELGGAERMMISLARGIDKERFDVRALTFYHATATSLDAQLPSAGVEVISLGKRVGFDPRMFSRAAFALRALAPDILHTHRPVFAYLEPSIVGRLRGRVVHTVHNVAQHEVAGAMRRFSHWLAFRADVAPIAICDYAARTIEQVYGVSPYATIPNGIPVQEYAATPAARAQWRASNGIPESALVFTSVGRLAPQKNPVALVEAFAAVANPNRDGAMLLLAGGGELRPTVERRVRALGLERTVRFLGPRSDVPALLAASDVFVLASHYEGNPLAVMEAMASGLPVIATAVGALPELVVHGESGLLVPPSDDAALLQAFRTLAASRETRERMGSRAGERARLRFDVSLMIARYEALYLELLAQMGTSRKGAGVSIPAP